MNSKALQIKEVHRKCMTIHLFQAVAWRKKLKETREQLKRAFLHTNENENVKIYLNVLSITLLLLLLLIFTAKNIVIYV